MVPRATMENDLKRQQKELTDDISSLNKKARTPRRCPNLTPRQRLAVDQVPGKTVQRCPSTAAGYREFTSQRLQSTWLITPTVPPQPEGVKPVKRKRWFRRHHIFILELVEYFCSITSGRESPKNGGILSRGQLCPRPCGRSSVPQAWP
jgi:hypothetical protein